MWRTAVSCLLVFDYFLFTTGNPSVTYSFFGGWFEVTIIALVGIVISHGYVIQKGIESKQQFFLYLIVIGLFSFALIGAAPRAREFAEARLQAEVNWFIKDPINSNADASNEERQLMVKLESQEYSMNRETFIPTFRRMDYLLRAGDGKKYRLITTMSWNGTPVILLRRVDT